MLMSRGPCCARRGEMKIGRNDTDKEEVYKEEVCARVLIYPIRLGKREVYKRVKE